MKLPRGWSVLRVLHLVVGVGAFYAFGRSGLFMDQQLDHLVGMADGPRALYRSGHIYLLFTALLNLSLGFYLTPAGTLPARIAQYVGSTFLFLAFGYFLYGFHVETPLGLVERPRVRQGIYSSLNGLVFHGIGALLPDWIPRRLWASVPEPIRQRFGRLGR